MVHLLVDKCVELFFTEALVFAVFSWHTRLQVVSILHSKTQSNSMKDDVVRLLLLIQEKMGTGDGKNLERGERGQRGGEIKENKRIE